MDHSPPGSSVHGILHARRLEWAAFPTPGDLPDPGIEPVSPVLTCSFFTTEPQGKHTRRSKWKIFILWFPLNRDTFEIAVFSQGMVSQNY